MPTQSNATSTTGACLSASSTIPRADSGSFTPVAGGTSPSHNGDPGGGVTSTLNVATRRSTALALHVTNNKDSATNNPQFAIRNPQFLPTVISPLPEMLPLVAGTQSNSSWTFYQQLFQNLPASATCRCCGCRRIRLAAR